MRSFKTAFPSSFLRNYQQGTLNYSYRGIPCLKQPIDIAIFLKAIWDLRPKTLIEIGTRSGGSALLFADILQNFGLEARVFTIDFDPPETFHDPRVAVIRGDVFDLEGVFEEHGLKHAPHTWFVSEDSAHSFEACMIALDFLDRHMEAGDLLVMEDGLLEELGLSERYQGGPNWAIATYLAANPRAFEIATELCDMFGPNATCAPNGYLWKA